MAMNIKTSEAFDSLRTKSPNGNELQVLFVKSTIKYLTTMFQGSGNNNLQSQKAAVEFLNTTVRNLFQARALKPMDFFIRYPGYFYLMGYESKLYNEYKTLKNGDKVRKLRYYDAMPLIFVFEVDKEGFTGINFHWVNPKGRALLLRSILTAYPQKFMDDEIIRPMSWRILKRIIGPYRKKYYKIAIKRYLWSQMRKVKGIKIVRIPNQDMINAINYTSAMMVGITLRQMHQMWRKIITLPATPTASHSRRS
jgi:hypothetical protein